MFINNFYKSISLINTYLTNLNGIDNSFIAISSWSNLIYNTSTTEYNESIIINGLNVYNCSITSSSLAVPSSSLLIDSS